MKLAKILAPIAFLALFGCQGSVSDSETIEDDPETNPDPGDPDPGTDPTPTGGRVTDGLVALYNFDEGEGSIVNDATGSGYALTMEDPLDFTWLDGGGLSIDNDSALTNPAPATHINGPCKASDEVTVEMWGRTNSYLQDGPARIVSVSEDPQDRNFTLSQEYDDGVSYANFRLRTDETDRNGQPATMSDEDVFDGAIHHVVYTRSLAAGEGVVWLDGNIAGTLPLEGSFTGGEVEWDDSYPLTIGNEPTLNRPWRGELYLVAIYCKALNATEISTNMNAGY